MTTYTWTDPSTGQITLRFTDDWECPRSGPADVHIAALARRPDMAAQLAAIDPARVVDFLRETGAYTLDETRDPQRNLERMLWIATCDVAEDPDLYADKEPAGTVAVPRTLLESVLEYLQNYAADRNEPSDGDCWRTIDKVEDLLNPAG